MLLGYVFSACVLCVLEIKGMIIKWNKHKLVHASFLVSFFLLNKLNATNWVNTCLVAF